MPARGGGIGFTFSAVGAGGVRVKARCGLYAAIPSLHAGYAFLVFLFAAALVWGTRWRWWVTCPGALYAGFQSFAAVYTGKHYVVDADWLRLRRGVALGRRLLLAPDALAAVAPGDFERLRARFDDRAHRQSVCGSRGSKR
jgi:hypothetical protein